MFKPKYNSYIDESYKSSKTYCTHDSCINKQTCELYDKYEK